MAVVKVAKRGVTAVRSLVVLVTHSFQTPQVSGVIGVRVPARAGPESACATESVDHVTARTTETRNACHVLFISIALVSALIRLLHTKSDFLDLNIIDKICVKRCGFIIK